MVIKDEVLKKYNTICFDLDGTLLNDEKLIQKNTIEVIRKLQFAGCEIIIATGRSIEKSEEFLKEFNFPYTIVANNGAIAMDNLSKNILFKLPIEKNFFEKIYEVSQNLNILPYLHIYDKNNKYSLIIDDSKKREDFSNSVRSSGEILYMSEASKYLFDSILSVVFLDSYKNIEKICRAIESLNLNITSHTIYAFSKEHKMTEFLNKNATKGEGIGKVLKQKGKTWENVISFGDDNNDLSMITNSKLGISMLNGSNELKLSSDFVTEFDNNFDGVELELRKIYGGEYEKLKGFNGC